MSLPSKTENYDIILPDTQLEPAKEAQTSYSISKIRYASRLGANGLFCCAAINSGFTGKEEITINGVTAQKPYLGTLFTENGTRWAVMLLRIEGDLALDSLEITIANEQSTTCWLHELALDSGDSDYRDTLAKNFLGSLGKAELKKILTLLVKFSGLQTKITSDLNYINICKICRIMLSAEEITVFRALWLMPHILYMEVGLPAQNYTQPKLLNIGNDNIFSGASKVQILPAEASNNQLTYGVITVFNRRNAMDLVNNGNISLLNNDQVLPLQKIISIEANIRPFLQYLLQLSEPIRLFIRDFVNSALLENAPKDALTSNVSRSLQLYLLPAHSSVYNKNEPFGMNVETLLPLDSQGVFLSGWVHDPLHLIEKITLVSDLGFSIPIFNKMQYFARPDVLELYENSPFSSSNELSGFVAFVEYPEYIHKALENGHSCFSFRLQVSLKSGINNIISSKPEMFDCFSARWKLLNYCANFINKDDAAMSNVRDAAVILQNLCAKQARVQKTMQFGAVVEQPQATIIVPLYKKLEFLPAQIAHFANDAFMRNCEIIYVLDFPPQEQEVINLLEKLHNIYKISISLLVLSHNAGYATANNLAADYARAEHILLLNSDVVPIENNWLANMLDFYRAHEAIEGIGALAPKLLYDDNSIQHAGMYFALDAGRSFYENLHYYKGYPENYASSNENKIVPAVTGACLLISRDKFMEVGKFSTDFIIGDFEDSDLCLKLSARGLVHYYFADSKLYHFERQSMNSIDETNSARYWLNSSLQYAKWGVAINSLMSKYA